MMHHITFFFSFKGNNSMMKQRVLLKPLSSMGSRKVIELLSVSLTVLSG